jgi:hypothetical protein
MLEQLNLFCTKIGVNPQIIYELCYAINNEKSTGRYSSLYDDVARRCLMKVFCYKMAIRKDDLTNWKDNLTQGKTEG